MPTIKFDEFLAEQRKNPAFENGFLKEDAKLENAIALLRARENAGLSQRELAERSGVPQSLLNIPLDTLCTVFAFWVADMLMEPVEANLLAVLVVGLLSALFSRPVKQAVRRKKTPLEGEHDQANDDRLN